MCFSGEIEFAYLVHRCRGFCFFGAWATHEERQRRQQKHDHAHEPECVYEGKGIGLKVGLQAELRDSFVRCLGNTCPGCLEACPDGVELVLEEGVSVVGMSG